jgi:hypothetical protein
MRQDYYNQQFLTQYKQLSSIWCKGSQKYGAPVLYVAGVPEKYISLIKHEYPVVFIPSAHCIDNFVRVWYNLQKIPNSLLFVFFNRKLSTEYFTFTGNQIKPQCNVPKRLWREQISFFIKNFKFIELICKSNNINFYWYTNNDTFAHLLTYRQLQKYLNVHTHLYKKKIVSLQDSTEYEFYQNLIKNFVNKIKLLEPTTT